MADRVLANDEPIAAASFEGMFMLKIRAAQIVYDASSRLHRAQQKARRNLQMLPSTYAARYAAWFWLNHGLMHMRRMAQSDDPLYLTAVDMMLAAGLSEVTRAYDVARNLAWQGEKAALRYLQEHDPAYLALLRDGIAVFDRAHKLNRYEELVRRALAPMGDLWTPGIAAVFLRDADQGPADLDAALGWWEELF
jgi:hypothetical protein